MGKIPHIFPLPKKLYLKKGRGNDEFKYRQKRSRRSGNGNPGGFRYICTST